MKQLIKLPKVSAKNMKALALSFAVVAIILGPRVAYLARGATINANGTITPTTIKSDENQDSTNQLNNPQQADITTQQQAAPSAPSNTDGGDYHVSTVCRDEVYPYKTFYYDNSSMYVGETKVTRTGVNGSITKCVKTYDGKDWGVYYGEQYTAVQDVTYPTDEWVDRGTKAIPIEPTPTPTYTYDQALQMATNTCQPVALASGTDSSAYQSCISTALANYGY